MKDETMSAPTKQTDTQTPVRARFIDPQETRRPPLGSVRTEEEARLAAEIDKLLDPGR